MARRAGRRNVDWETPETLNWEQAGVEVLMDIREELRTLNRLLACRNFTGIPATLRAISRNTKKEPK